MKKNLFRLLNDRRFLRPAWVIPSIYQGEIFSLAYEKIRWFLNHAKMEKKKLHKLSWDVTVKIKQGKKKERKRKKVK